MNKPDNIERYQGHYSESGFWSKVKKVAAKAGAKVIYVALILYYELTDPNVSPVYQDFDKKLDALFSSKNRPSLFYVAIGNTDFLYNSNKDFRAKLDAKGYPYEYVETDGGHIWRNWRKYLADFAPRIFK